MTPNDRIKQEASIVSRKLLQKTDGDVIYMVGYEAGYIAGATAEHGRAKVLVDALEGLLQWHTQPNNLPAEGLDRRLEAARKALEQWEGKEPVKDEPKPPPPDLGICKECKTKPAVTDYNGHGHYVCQICDNSLNRDFDEEYN